MPDQAGRLSSAEWTVLTVLREHYYDYRDKGGKPDDPGWHRCKCGWEGYWCDYEPHVAVRIVAMTPPARETST